ncbi:MAG: DUF4349 domain-containing protein [Candidatus Paceibacterota bacterium]|jgi:hypothetical protein
MNNNDQSLRFGLLPRYISWLTVVLAFLTLGTFFAIANPSGQYSVTPMMTGVGGGRAYSGSAEVTAGVPAQDSGVAYPTKGMMNPAYYPYPYPNPDVPVTDTREFLKVYYNAMMRTRDVPALTRRVETTVRGYEGRIDSESSATKYGYVSFALPQAKYEAFRAELEGMVDSRFLTINISSENLLAQKVSIEEQQKQATAALASYKIAREKLVATHTSAVQALQARLDVPDISIGDRALLEKQLANENALYTSRLSNADANIKYAQDWIKAVQTQDKTLLENVATVTGTVSIQWISLWEVAELYLPGYWIPALLAVLTALSYLRDRRRDF